MKQPLLQKEIKKIDNQKHRFGFVALVGRANVGKSTLLNKLVGANVSIISKKPQTTRITIRGILSEAAFQAVFVDTAGIHHPKSELQKRMVHGAYSQVQAVDLVLFLLETLLPKTNQPDPLDLEIAKKLNPKNTILVINKMDLASEERLFQTIDYWRNIFLAKDFIPISALKGHKISRLKNIIVSSLPEQPPHYPTDWITESNFSQIAAEFVREQAFRILMQELPYGLSCVTEKVITSANLIKISVCLYCSRKGHKKMLIGAGGEMLKKIGTRARIKLEHFSKKKIFLSLYVKQVENWQNKPSFLSEMGLGKV